MDHFYRPLAALVQIIIGEYDDDGNLVAEHALPPDRILYPFGRNLDEQVHARAQEFRKASQEPRTR